jgi:plastocyanin
MPTRSLVTGILAVALAGAALSTSAAVSAAIPVFDDCQEAAYVDRTADGADRTLTWDFSFAGSPERCLKIRVGQSVQWDGHFAAHPLESDQGDRPNPIVANLGDSGLIRFDRPGVFGFRCNFHFEMRGAIQVVPAATAVPWGKIKGGLLLASLLAAIAALAGLRRPAPPQAPLAIRFGP